MLGSIQVVYTEKDGKLGYEYSFEDYIIKGYSGQDNVQVGAVVSTIITRIKLTKPKIKSIIFQSDNASCFASQELIPFIHHINTQMRDDRDDSVQVTRWLFTEEQTGRGRLDTHFSFLNIKFNSYVEYSNDMVSEDNIFQAMTHREGVTGTTAILLNCS